MKQKITFQKSSEKFVMLSEFFAVHGWGGDALSTGIVNYFGKCKNMQSFTSEKLYLSVLVVNTTLISKIFIHNSLILL